MKLHRQQIACCAFAFLLMSSSLLAQQIELQSGNPGFWDNTPANDGGPRTNWRISGSGELTSGPVQLLDGDDDGVYQIVPINGNSRYHMVLAQGYRVSDLGGQADWSGFGVNYYDDDWGFLAREEKTFQETPPGEMPRLKRHWLGARIPEGATRAVLWVWNVSADTKTVADNVGLYNYFPANQFSFDENRPEFGKYELTEPEFRNVVINGDIDFRATAEVGSASFRPDEPNNVEFLFPRLGGDEFWNKSNPFNESVVPRILTNSLEIGNFVSPTAAYQWIDLEPGERYSFRSLVFRRVLGENFAALQGHFGTIGVDFFDENWNEISEVTQRADASRLSDFVVPENTRYSFVWLWSPPANGIDFTFLNLRSLVIKKAEAADFAPKVFLQGQPAPITESNSDPLQFSLFSHALDPVSFGPGDVTVTGPNGVVRSQGIAGGNFGDGIWELYYAFPPGGSWGPEDNGVYEIRVDANFSFNATGESPAEFLGTFEVNIDE